MAILIRKPKMQSEQDVRFIRNTLKKITGAQESIAAVDTSPTARQTFRSCLWKVFDKAVRLGFSAGLSIPPHPESTMPTHRTRMTQ